jgi:hypothetical protein
MERERERERDGERDRGKRRYKFMTAEEMRVRGERVPVIASPSVM